MSWFVSKKSNHIHIRLFFLVCITLYTFQLKSQAIQGKWIGYYVEKNTSNRLVLPKTIIYQIYLKLENSTLYGVAYRGDENNVLSKIFVNGKYDSSSHIITLNEFRVLENPLGDNCLFNMNLKVDNDCLIGNYFSLPSTLNNNFCNEGYIYLEREKQYKLSDNLFAKILETPSSNTIAKRKSKPPKTTTTTPNTQLSLTYFETKSNVFSASSIEEEDAYTALNRRKLFNVGNLEIKDSLIHIILYSPNNSDTFSLFQGGIMIVPKIIFSQPFNMWISLNSTFSKDNIILLNLSKKKPSTLPIEIELLIGRNRKTIPIVVDTNNTYKLNFSLTQTP